MTEGRKKRYRNRRQKGSEKDKKKERLDGKRETG